MFQKITTILVNRDSLKKFKVSEVGALEILIYVGQTREIHSIKLIIPKNRVHVENLMLRL